MKTDDYKVYFANGFSVTVNAIGKAQAIILAQAIQVRAGRDYFVTDIKLIK